MFNNLYTRSGFMGALLAATLLSPAAMAQRKVQEVHSPGNQVLTCCKCIGGSTQGLNLNTIPSVPWTVTGPTGPSGIDDTNDSDVLTDRASSATMVTSAPLAIPASNSAWSNVPGALWIGPVGAVQTPGTYKYEIKFDARKCTIPSSIQISGQFLADNEAKLYVDGVFVKASDGTTNYGFLAGSLTPFSYTIPASASAGIHTITVKAYNQSGPTGISVQLNVKRNCTNDIEIYEGPPRE